MKISTLNFASFLLFLAITPSGCVISNSPEDSDQTTFSSGGATLGSGGDGPTQLGSGGSETLATGGTPSSGGTIGNTGGNTSSGGAAANACTIGSNGFTQGDGYVVDSATCVYYQVFDSIPAKLSHADAIATCDSLSLGGFDDWRLPSVEELSAIVVKGNLPSVDPLLFPNTDNSMYWTSMTTADKVTCLDFYYDGMQNDHIGPDGAQAYRCVR